MRLTISAAVRMLADRTPHALRATTCFPCTDGGGRTSEIEFFKFAGTIFCVVRIFKDRAPWIRSYHHVLFYSGPGLHLSFVH